MLKFLRKYNTLILVIGGSLLMVVFLVPQAIERIGQNPSNLAYAKVEDRTISQQDFLEVQRSWQYINQIVPLAVVIMQIENPDHWLLLNEEAEKYDLIGGATDGARSIDFFAEYIAEGIVSEQMRTNPWAFQTNEQFFQAIQTQTETVREDILQRLEAQTAGGRSELAYYRALAKLRGITRLLMTYESLAGLSIPETQIAAADLFDRVTADLAVIPAGAFRPDPQSLDPDEVRSHFETYRETPPGAGDFGFGYLLPDAVQYEYLRVNSEAIVDSRDASAADLLEYFRRNEGRYAGQDFEQARQRVRTDYIRSIAEERLDSITTALQRERLRASQSLPRDTAAERYRVVPDDWQGPPLDDYAQTARETSGLTGQPAEDLVTVSEGPGEFQSLQDLRASDLQLSRYEFTATDRIAFGDLMMSAKEFGGDERLDLQRGLLFGPLVLTGSGTVGDLIFVRITDVREQGPPQSLEEVEERVREDLATLRGYERLSDQVETFRSAFADGDFTWFSDMDFSNAEGASQYIDVVIGTDTVQTQLGESLAQFAQSPLPEQVIEHARTFDPTQPLSEIPADDRTIAVLMPDSLALGLTTIKAYRPTTVNRLREGMVQIEQRLTQQARQLSTRAPYTFDSLSDRLGFQRLDREEEEEF